MKEESLCHVPTDMFKRARGLDGLVLACLWSNPDITATGITPKAKEAIAYYSGMTAEDVAAAFERLAVSGQAVLDANTREVLVPEWLQFNYLQEGTPSAHPADVLAALDAVSSGKIRDILVKEIARLDVQFDASGQP